MANKIEKSPEWYQQLEIEYIDAVKKKEALEDQIKNLRTQILDSMNKENLKKISTSKTQVKIIKEHIHIIVDGKRLKKEQKEIYKKYSHVSTISEYIQISIKKK